ncbi:MAG: Sapep family Mn(2+)-dependent dipeptidase [Ruminococcus sp.]|nr:Sapep family Mn(2+)-dependent dipeptidase [Ruminococcus sp.]
MLQTKVNQIIEENKAEMLETLRKLIAFPSVATHIPGDNPPYGAACAKALDLVLETAENMGFAVRNYEYRAGAADWSADMDAPELGILSHLDVVPVMAENWTSDPFTMVERDGCLYGRGTIDNKGPAVAALYAMHAIRKAGIPLKKNVRLLFGCDEENGGSDIVYYLTQDKMPPMVFTPDGNYPVIHIEKGMIRLTFTKKTSDPILSMEAGTAPNAVPAAAEATLCSGEKASFTGLAAHASTPESGNNAITGLLTALSEDAAFADCKAITELFPHGCTGGEGLGIAHEDEKSGRLTCICSMMHIQDGEITGTVDIRYPVSVTKEALLEKLEARFAQFGFTMNPLLMNDPHCVPEESDFVQTLLSVYEEETGDKGYCIAIGGGTYVHEIEGGVAFGAELPGWDYHMHGDDEFFPIDQLMMTTRMIAAAILKLCGA